MSGTTIRIEDDDGFATEWPWPDDRLALANGDFVAVYEALHDAQRVAGGSDDWRIQANPPTRSNWRRDSDE